MKRFFILMVIIAALVAPLSQSAWCASVARPEAITLTEPSINTRKGALEIICPADGKQRTFHIYSITGQLIKKIQNADQSFVIELPQGCYIIKCEAWVKKAIVC